LLSATPPLEEGFSDAFGSWFHRSAFGSGAGDRISCDRRVFQNLPDRPLPTALRSDNPSDATRRIDGAQVLT
jgi:hypothetical protein